jgi:membrane protein DedA with SNARE-associated domain
MAQYLFDLIRGHLAEHGYWTVAIALLLENAGIPVPGETILLLASFLAYSEHHLSLPYIILVGVIAATAGDNLGFLIGYHGGRPLLARYHRLLRIRPETVARGEELFDRYGAATILIARFIAGLRIIAGPLAGVLRMNWRKFVLFNFLGAALWVTVISSVGFLFGKHWEKLVEVLKGVNLIFFAAALAAGAIYWLRRRRKV